MTRQHALREARKRWKNPHIRADETLSSPEKRLDASQAYAALDVEIHAIDAEISALLAVLEPYQILLARRAECRKHRERFNWDRSYHKFAVGHIFGIGFHVEGSGDTWEEAFEQADRKKAADAALYAGRGKS